MGLSSSVQIPLLLNVWPSHLGSILYLHGLTSMFYFWLITVYLAEKLINSIVNFVKILDGYNGQAEDYKAHVHVNNDYKLSACVLYQ